MTELFIFIIGITQLAICLYVVFLSKRVDDMELKFYKKFRKKRTPSRKPILSNDDLADIQVMMANGDTKTDIAFHYGVSRQTLYTALERLK